MATCAGVQPISWGDGDDLADDVVAADLGVGASNLRHSAGRTAEVFAGQSSFGERAPGEHRQVERVGHRQKFPFRGAVEQVVAQLDGGER
jgi:hypothetical protein